MSAPKAEAAGLTVERRAELRVLAVCDQNHGSDHNTSTVYGHFGSRRICIRLFETDAWIYDPRWEVC